MEQIRINKISKYFFLNIYNTNPPEKRINFDELINNNQDDIIAILIACNKRNMPIYFQHSMIKDFCKKANLEVNEDSIKKLQQEALFYFLKSDNKSHILNLLSKLKNSNVIFYEEEQNIRISISNEKNLAILKNTQTNILQTTNPETNLIKDNDFANLIEKIQNLIEKIQNLDLKNKALDVLKEERILNVAILGLQDSGKQTLLNALNQTSYIDKTNGILRISNKNDAFNLTEENLELLEYYDKSNMDLQTNLCLHTQMTKQNIEFYKIPHSCNPYTKIYAQNIINNADLILYLINLNKKINNEDCEKIAEIFMENKLLTIVFTHFDLVNLDEIKIIKKSLINKICFVLKRYKISEMEVLNKLNFIYTAPNITLLYLTNNSDLALSKGFRLQDSGIYELENHIKESLLNNKEKVKSIKKEILLNINILLKIYMRKLKNEMIDLDVGESLLESYGNDLKRLNQKICNKIKTSLNISFEAVSQNESNLDKKIFLKIKIIDALNDVFKMSSKDFESLNINFLDLIKDNKKTQIIVLKINSLQSIFKKRFNLYNNFLSLQITNLLNEKEGFEDKDFEMTYKTIMASLNISEKINFITQKIQDSINEIKELIKIEIPHNPEKIKEEIKNTRHVLASLTTINE